jgi:uncharacterized phage-like protein YoqJ
MIVAATGHRPDKLGVDVNDDQAGYVENNPLRVWVKGRIRDYLRRVRPLYAISGMAIGVDQDFVEVCIDLRIPFIAAIPFVGQERRWRPKAQAKYRALLAKAYEVVVVSEGGYERWKMLARNEWMVDHCSEVCAVFDGSPGGTAATVLYADRVQRPIYRVDPNEFRELLGATT